MRVNREALLHKLVQVSPGLATREILEQSASFVFKDGKIYTFNDEILCEADYKSDIEGAVHAAPLVALLNKLSEDDLDIISKDGELLISGKKSRAGIRMHQEILLPFDAVDKPDGWKPLHPEFSDALEVVQGSASKDDLHFNLTCIHLSPNHVEACDGYQMTRYVLDTGLLKDCLIKRESAKSVVGLGLNRVSEGKNWIHFRSDDLTISCRRWVQDYIDLDETLDFKGKKTTLPGGLAEAVEKAEIFSSNNASENQVLIQIKEGRLRLKGEGAHGWFEERTKIEYDGDPISFLIPPKLLTEITKRTNDCEVTSERLRIDAGKFVFVACLGAVDSKPQATAEADEPEEKKKARPAKKVSKAEAASPAPVKRRRKQVT